MIFKKLLQVFEKGNTLYYPGCLTTFVLPKIKKNYERIFEMLDVDFIEIEANCCGLPCYNNGYLEDFRKLRKKNIEIFNEYNVKEIICSCPSCYYTFSKLYKARQIKVIYAVNLILEKLQKKFSKEDFKVKKEKVTFHDPCHLSRYCNIINEPREVLTFLGYQIEEMKHCKENSLCCGAGSNFRVNFEKISKAIAIERVKEAKEKAKILITCCPLCYLQLKDASNSVGGIKVFEISQVVLRELKKVR